MRKLEVISGLVIGIVIILFIINWIVIGTTKKQIVNKNYQFKDIDCILVLGAGIRGDKPSPMLQDRLDVAIELYNLGIKKILVSGDHQEDDYDEVNVMKNYLLENNIPSEDIFVDHYGISTYDSIYRLRSIFKVNRVIIVSQEYHLYRALYIANMLDYQAYGVSADKYRYFGQEKRDVREFFARVKDMIKSIMRPNSEYLGEVYHIDGDGNKTNDKKIG